MKKRIRNCLLAVTAAASSFLLLSGFDSAVTVQDIMSNSQAYMSAAPGMTCELQGEAHVSFDMTKDDQTQSLPMTGNLGFIVQYTLDPFCFAVTGSASGDVSLLQTSGEVTLDAYMVSQEDGSGTIYMRVPAMGDDAWHAASLPAEDVSQVKNMFTSAMAGDMATVSGQTGIDLAGFQDTIYSNLAVAPEPATVDGLECYEVTGAISGDTFIDLINQVSSAVSQTIDESTMMVLEMILGGIQIDITIHYATDNFQPVAALVDLSNSDFSMIAQMFSAMMMPADTEDSGEMPMMNLTVNKLYLTAFYAESNAAIEVPAEALAAEAETSLSISDAMDMAGNVAGASGVSG